jgi:predicted nucleic-acid-binding protein
VIGLDTNVLVRYIAQDDHKQSPLAAQLIDDLSSDDPGFVTTVALVELVWVMQSCYSATKPEIISILEMLVRTRQLVVENVETVIKAISLFSVGKADFADCLITRSSAKAGCVRTLTFDKSAAKYGGMQLLA